MFRLDAKGKKLPRCFLEKSIHSAVANLSASQQWLWRGLSWVFSAAEAEADITRKGPCLLLCRFLCHADENEQNAFCKKTDNLWREIFFFI